MSIATEKYLMTYVSSFRKWAKLVSLTFETNEIFFTNDSQTECYQISAHTSDKAELPTPLLKAPLSHDISLGLKAEQSIRNQSLLENLIEHLNAAIEVERLRNTELRFKTIFEQSPFSIQILAPDGRTLMVNRAWKNLWKIPEESIQNYILNGYNMLEDKHLEANGVLEFIRKGFNGEVSQIPLIQYDPKAIGVEGSIRAVEGIIYPLKDESDAVQELVLIHLDVTDAKRIEAANTFLSKVSSILLSTLDYEKAIHNIAEACVPDIADGTVIDLINEEGQIERYYTHHRDHEIEKFMHELQEKYPPTFDSPQPTAQVLKTGKPILIESFNTQDLLKHTKSAEHAEIIMNIGVKSLITLPLIIKGKIIGSINLVITTTDRELYDNFDLQTAIELSNRASIAIENATLFKKARASIFQRDEFISIASHELKTPITSMKLQLQVADRQIAKNNSATIDTSHVKKLTESSLKQLNRLTVLVEDMLDISRIASGKLAINLQKTNITQLLKETLTRFQPQVDHLGIGLKSHIEDSVFTVCDPFRFEQVISNLISNAIRYGDRKPIEVSLTKNSTHIEIAVKDLGIGIAKKDHERIFERFERAISAQNISGLGLGLYISREIMRQHNGELLVESELGLGSTFIARLPIS